MNLTPLEFIQKLIDGKTEYELNRTESQFINHAEVRKLIRHYGHTSKSAVDHVTTDYSNGFTICKKCGSFFPLGKGFTKHLSDGCLHCEGEAKHYTYWHEGNNERDYKSPARFMSVMFDDGMHYTKDKLQIEKFKEFVPQLENIETVKK